MDRFWNKVQKTDGCWLWLGSRSTWKGILRYGTFWLHGRSQKAHRVAWFLHYGEWPKGVLLHSCDNEVCVRVDHLTDGTQYDNVHDMMHKGRLVLPQRKLHCL